MASVVPVDEFITDEWYPGFRPAFDHAPFVIEPFRTFSKQDEERFWFLDFHWTRGLTPLGLVWNEDGYSWGTQLAAEQMPLPSGRGVTQRIAGTHTYASAIPVESPFEVATRAERLRGYLPQFLRNFPTLWAQRTAELEEGFTHFRDIDIASASLPELATMLRDARNHYRRAFEIHFEMMYPLLAHYRGFRGVCSELGIESGVVGKLLQGHDTKITETDRELWRLTAAARAAGLTAVFRSTEAENVYATLGAAGGAASGWLAQLTGFLDRYGFRAEGTGDVALPSWREDPTPVIGTIKTFLESDHDHDFDAALRRAHAEREEALDATRSRLTLREQETFEAALTSVQAANFPRWQDDHNYYIDLRAALPLRWAALGIAAKVGADRLDDTIFLFWPELVAVASGARRWREFRALVEERRQYFDHWQARRGDMPKVLGTVPDAVADPILIEIFGLNRHYLAMVKAGATGSDVRRLTGIPGAGGTGRGPARVVRDAEQLYRVRPGEVLVCESTTPNWNTSFAKIAACVCDAGGTLSHAAIVGREYAVPTVTACALATSVIRDGDEIEVDGDRGVVTVIRSARNAP